MICPHCQFNNLDDKRYCVRCGRFLLVGDIDATPPRARRRGGFRHLYYAFRRAKGFRWSEGDRAEIPEERCRRSLFRVPYWLSGWFVPSVIRISPERPMGMRMSLWLLGWLVPSAAQFASGRVKRGWIFLGIFLAGLICWGLLIGTFWWQLSPTMLAASYVMSLFDYYFPAYRGQWKRILVNAALSIVFFVFAYSCCGYLDTVILHYTGGVRVLADYRNAVLAPYDIVKVVRRNEYRGGDIVQFSTMPGVYFRGAPAIYDRLLAGPGETVVIKNNQLLAKDGSPWPLKPISEKWGWRDSEVTVRENQFMVIPSVIRQGLNAAPIIGRGNISGKVTRIIFPWWRRQTL